MIPDWLAELLNTDRPDRVFFRLLILVGAVALALAFFVSGLRHRGKR